MPMATRSGVPNKLASTGVSNPFGFSNKMAGPPARKVRSQISVISRLGSTSCATRTSSFLASSCFIKSRKSLYFIVTCQTNKLATKDTKNTKINKILTIGNIKFTGGITKCFPPVAHVYKHKKPGVLGVLRGYIF